MIDPRNMPCARVCLSRMSPRELPPNALAQYHNYVAKRKSSDPTLLEAKETDRTGIPVQHPPVHYSFVSGASGHQHTGVNSLNVTKDTTATLKTVQSSHVKHSRMTGVNNHLGGGINTLNVTKETIRTGISDYHPSVKCSHIPDTGVNSLMEAKETSVNAVPIESPPEDNLCILSDGVDTKAANVWPRRRNSVVSTSSSHSSVLSRGRELVASVRLSPVSLHRRRSSTGKSVICKPESKEDCNDKTLPGVTDDSTLSGTKSTSGLPYFMRTNLKPKDFYCEDVSSVTSSLSTADTSEQRPLSDESTPSTDFTSFKDHVMYGCEDVWPDFNSYSPPESPAQNNETAVSEELEIRPERTKRFLPVEADSIVPLETGTFEMDTEDSRRISDTNGLLYSLKSEARRPSTESNLLLSPEIKLIPLDKNSYKHNERRLSYPIVSPLKRKSLSPKGELVVKISDLGDKLNPSSSGGLTVINSVKPGRCTTSGRRILANYSEKSLAKSAIKGALPTEVKKRKARKCGGGNESANDANYKPGQKSKKRKRNPKNPARCKTNFLLRYENLKFKELNTIPRISTRYKVAFTKWPYVFSGALDLINQRLTNQNAFWDSIRS